MNKEKASDLYIGLRFLEIVCIVVFMFGFMWHTSEVYELTLQQWMMLYGGSGALLIEAVVRIIKKKGLDKIK